jgi:hypothetical protein
MLKRCARAMGAMGAMGADQTEQRTGRRRFGVSRETLVSFTAMQSFNSVNEEQSFK